MESTMDRHPTEEDRDALIADLTERLVRDWSRRLLAKEQRAISDLHNVVLDRLSESDAAAIFIQAVTDPAGAEVRFSVLAAKAMRDAAEADAIRSVEFMEKARAESRNDNRIAQAELARALH
jgi:hypothetical protein